MNIKQLIQFWLLFNTIQCLGIQLTDKKPKCLYMQAKQGDIITIKYLAVGNHPEDIKFFLFDPFNIQYNILENETKFEAVNTGKHRICFKNNNNEIQIVEFDFDIYGIDKNYASKNDLLITKQNLNQIDSDFKWISMLQKESYHREQLLKNNLTSLITQLNISTMVKSILCMIIIMTQLIIINSYLKSRKLIGDV